MIDKIKTLSPSSLCDFKILGTVKSYIDKCNNTMHQNFVQADRKYVFLRFLAEMNRMKRECKSNFLRN